MSNKIHIPFVFINECARSAAYEHKRYYFNVPKIWKGDLGNKWRADNCYRATRDDAIPRDFLIYMNCKISDSNQRQATAAIANEWDKVWLSWSV